MRHDRAPAGTRAVVMSGQDRGSAVLLQESDRDLRRVVAESLEQRGWRVLEADGRRQAQAVLESGPCPSVLIVEFGLSDQSTEAIIDAYRQHASKAGKVVITTERRLRDEWRQSFRPDAVIYKPFDTRYLVKFIRNLIRG